jgi:hypothetical protein
LFKGKGRGKREEGRGKREERREKRDEGRQLELGMMKDECGGMGNLQPQL